MNSASFRDGPYLYTSEFVMWEDQVFVLSRVINYLTVDEKFFVSREVVSRVIGSLRVGLHLICCNLGVLCGV